MDNDTNTNDEESRAENEYNLNSGELLKEVQPVAPPKAPAKKKTAAPLVEANAEMPAEAAEKLKQKVAKAKAALPKAKPVLEGINSPKSTSDVIMVAKPKLTEQENKLIEEMDEEVKKPQPKLMPASVVDRVGQKPGNGKKIALIIIALLALLFGGYEIYNWNPSKAENQPQGQSKNNTPPANTDSVNPPVDILQPYTASSTPTTTPVIATSTPPTAIPPSVPIKKLKINSTPTGWLNFRSGPSLNNKVISKVYPGEVYAYSEAKSGWYKITLTDGRAGWVFGQYITLQ